ncbi:MAG: hypothetical protein COB23_02980 [Methylophaga sp.]|nr:MAG: hypothetical protein COB23_02980 [Methylophaga sp.]
MSELNTDEIIVSLEIISNRDFDNFDVENMVGIGYNDMNKQEHLLVVFEEECIEDLAKLNGMEPDNYCTQLVSNSVDAIIYLLDKGMELTTKMNGSKYRITLVECEQTEGQVSG